MAKERVDSIFSLTAASQIYPILPSILWDLPNSLLGTIAGFTGVSLFDSVTIHETVEKKGLTLQLVSATNSNTFSEYLSDKGLILPNKAREILEEYIGQEYSFVVTWISDIELFLQEQKKDENPGNITPENSLGVFVTFPTEKMYFPMRPTSIYESKNVPVDILVMGYVKPEVYPEIKPYTDAEYFVGNIYSRHDSLKAFFFEKRMPPNFGYTRISIDAPSKYLVRDLWIEQSAPHIVSRADFIYRNTGLIYLFVAGLSSILACLLAWKIACNNFSEVGILKLCKLGLCNIFTIISFAIATRYLKFKEVGQEIKDYILDKGREVFEEQTRKFVIILVSFIPIIFIQLNMIKYTDISNLYFTFYCFAIATLCFYLSLEKVKYEHTEYIPSDLKILNKRKLSFLFKFITIVSILAIIVSSAVLPKLEGASTVQKYTGATDETTAVAQLHPGFNALVATTRFAISLGIGIAFSLAIIALIRSNKKLQNTDKLYIFSSDKLLFISLFSVLFIAIAFIFTLLLSGLIKGPINFA